MTLLTVCSFAPGAQKPSGNWAQQAWPSGWRCGIAQTPPHAGPVTSLGTQFKRQSRPRPCLALRRPS